MRIVVIDGTRGRKLQKRFRPTIDFTMISLKAFKHFCQQAILALTGRSRGNHRRLHGILAGDFSRPSSRSYQSGRPFVRRGRPISLRKARSNELIWNAIRDVYRAGDEILIYSSSPKAWQHLGGRLEVFLVRDNRAVLEEVLIRS